MAQVKLAKTWYAPNGIHYGKGVQDIPSNIIDALPSTAVVLDEVKPEPEAKAEKPAPKAEK